MGTQESSDVLKIGWKYSPSLTKIEYLKKYAVGTTVLEIGSGMGWYSKYLRGMGFIVTAVDVNPLAQIDGIELIKSDFVTVDLNERSFDTVVMFDVLEHIKNEGAALRKVNKLCKKRLIISVPNSNDVFLTKYNLTYSHYRDKSHFREYTLSDVKNILNAHGFKLIETNLEGPAKPQVIVEFINSRISFLKILLRKFITLLEKCHVLSLEVTGADIFAVADKEEDL